MMPFKIFTVLLIVAHISVHCNTPQKSYNFLRVPNTVDTIDMTPNINGGQIKFFNQNGEPIIPDQSWNTTVYTNDQRIIKHLESAGRHSGLNLSVVNNNEHVITQNNFQKQVWPIPPRPKEDFDFAKKSGLLSLVTSAITSHKGLILFGSVGLCWIGFLSKLLHSGYAISSQSNWGTWNAHLTIETLHHSNQIELAQGLFFDIQKSYAEKPNSFLTPLVYFITEADAELTQLKNFLRLHEMVGTLKLTMLFPKQLELKETASNRIVRLEFLKNLVNTYATEYKVSN